MTLEPFTRSSVQAMWRLTRGMTLGVRVVVTNASGHVLLVEHTYVRGWQLPGGGIDRGETAEAAAARELLEETGLRAERRPILLSIHSHETHFRGDHVLLYRVEDWTGEPKPRAGEIARVGFFDPAALPDQTTRATRARIAEALGSATPDPAW